MDIDGGADWQRRVVDRSLRSARARSIDRGWALIVAATALLERSAGDDFTVQDVADEAGQSLRTLYQYFESKDDLLLAVFEEALRAFAASVRAAIADLDDPVDRLVGGLIAVARMPEHSGDGVKGGLARLRLKLVGVEPELVGRAREPIVTLLAALVADAARADTTVEPDPEAAAYLLISLTNAVALSGTLGNAVGPALPTPEQVVAFCLQGLGVPLAPERYRDVAARLRLPRGPYRPRKRRTPS